jgi:hypothetical protein
VVKHPLDQKKLARLGVRPSEWLQLLSQYEHLLSAFQLADWSDHTARERIASLLVKHTQQYLTSLELTLQDRSDEPK